MRRSDLRKLYTIKEQTNPTTGRKEKLLVYIGKHYTVDIDRLRARRLPMLLCLLLCTGLFLWAGFVPATAQRSMYVLPCFIISLLPLGYGWMALIKIWHMHASIDEVQHTEGLLSLQHAALGLTTLHALWFAADAVFTLLNRSLISLPADLIFLLCSIGCTAAGIALHLLIKPFKAEEIV